MRTREECSARQSANRLRPAAQTALAAGLLLGLDTAAHAAGSAHAPAAVDYWSLLFVFALSTFIGLGIIRRVSRLLHTPLMSITNAISAIAVVGSILVAGSDYPASVRILGAIALFASMTNIVSGFLITDRMLKMYKTDTDKSKKAEQSTGGQS
jgi:NAD(P) transhydrogenase subunit alpha